MKLIRFLLKRSKGISVFAVLAGVAAGISNSALLALISSALSGGHASAAQLVLPFAGLCLLMILSRVVSEGLLLRLSQTAVYELRMDLSRRILAAPLRHLEELGAHRLLATLTEDVPVIANTLTSIPVLCMQVAIVVSILVYMGWLSPLLLLYVLGFMVLGVATYQLATTRGIREMALARTQWDLLFDGFNALTGGAKELKLHHGRREAFFAKILRAAAAAVRRHNVKGISIFIAAASWGHFLFFVLIGLLIFTLPLFGEVSARTLTAYTITLLYMIGPLQIILNMFPELGRANVAVRKVEELGLSLAAHATESDSTTELGPGHTWGSLSLAGVTHAYRRERESSSFTLGPIDLTFHPGELVFLVGGNGSGKTTLAKLLTGLYVPESGELRLDSKLITDDNRESYRQLFSVVFSDFHLFESLLGLEAPELDAAAHDYMVRLQLDHKVQVSDGKLSTTELSQGQRKRLALLTAYLEDRPFYVFDEWAADQDPLFKETFYLRLLPELKSRGKTLLVISHDDRYYHLADRIIKLDYGRIEYDRPATHSSFAAESTASPR